MRSASSVSSAARVQGTAFVVLFVIGFAHLLNDMIQSVVPAVYPLIKEKFGLSFAQIGIITLVFQLTSSILQPFVGRYADRHPRPYSLFVGMCFTLVGLCALAVAPDFRVLVAAVSIIGFGSSIFHPEASQVAQLASGFRSVWAASVRRSSGGWPTVPVSGSFSVSVLSCRFWGSSQVFCLTSEAAPDKSSFGPEWHGLRLIQAPFPVPAVGPNGFGLPAVRRKGAASVVRQIQQSAGGIPPRC